MCDANEYPNEATIGDQRKRSRSEPLWSKPTALSASDWHRLISCLAYETYLHRGKLQGHDLDDWLAAEEAVLSQLTRPAQHTGEGLDGTEAK